MTRASTVVGHQAARTLVVLATVVLAWVVSAPLLARAPQAQTFRAVVDLIPLDVQVVDGDGQPIAGLSAADFDVTLDGRKRRVVSVDFVRFGPPVATAAPSDSSSKPPGSPDEAPSPGSPAAPVVREAPAPPRVFILAIDCLSIDPGEAKRAFAATAAFVARLRPDDEVGLFTFPNGPRVDPTRDHAAVVAALDKVATRRAMTPSGQFTLTPSDLVELSPFIQGNSLVLSESVGGSSVSSAEARFKALCGGATTSGQGADLFCQIQLGMAVSSELLYHEGLAQAGFGMLERMLGALAGVQVRKTVVLVSGGVLSSDTPRARPDNRDLAYRVGRAAAAADVSVYTLFLQQLTTDPNTAQTRGAPSVPAPARDRTLLTQFLSDFSGSAGGTLFTAITDNGEHAFTRILTESAAYYLLGVEPTPQDRDGRHHELRVKVRGRPATIRSRSWVVIPKPGSVPANARATLAAGSLVPTANAPATLTPPAPVVTPEVRTLASAFERSDREALTRRFSQPDSANDLRAIRLGAEPWPSTDRRAVVFALDVAIAGLHSPVLLVQQEALRLLAKYVVLVQQPTPNDPFECAWLRVESAGLQGLVNQPVTTSLIQRAVDRCPADSRLRFAWAVASDQALRLEMDTAAPVGTAPDWTARARPVLALYEAASDHPDTAFEARVRAAWLLDRVGQFEEGLRVLDRSTAPSPDPYVRYLGELVRGHLCRALGRRVDAEAAFRRALGAWPGAQSARVALMTTLLDRGDSAGATALADDVQANAPDEFDPWWGYWLGDYRDYLDLAARLREFIK